MHRKILLFLFSFILTGFLGNPSALAQSCTNGTETGTCTAVCSSGTDIPGATGCTDPSKGECCTGGESPTASPTGGFTYTLLEKIPGTDGVNLDLAAYLKALYNFAFWAIGIAALFMLTVGGFLYITSAGNTSRMETAKTIITDSLLGLVLAILAWLFLYVINPDLVRLNLPVIVPGSATTPQQVLPVTPPAVPPTPGTTQSLAQQVLNKGNITKLASGDCKIDATTPVTPLRNLQEIVTNSKMSSCFNGCKTSSNYCAGQTSINPTLLQAMLAVAETTSFTIISIAGGSHSPGSKHYSGNGIDVAKSSGTWAEFEQKFRAAGVSARCDNGTFVSCSDPSVNHVHIGT